MSLSGILSSSFYKHPLAFPNNPSQQQFHQLSKDLQSGNLSAAQSDFAALQKSFSQSPNTSALSFASTSNPFIQEFNQLGADLQSGNLSAAQKDFSTVQQDLQGLSGGRLHHRPHSTGNGGSGVQNDLLHDLKPDLNQPGQNLAPGNSSRAQQVYSNLQQEWQQSAFAGGTAAAQATALQTQPPLSLVA